MTAPLAGAPPSACAQELRDYVPARNKSVSNYKQYFQLSTVTSESSSGDTSSFVAETSVEIKPVETMNEPLTITDSLSNKGGSSITAITINNFFPQGEGSSANITDAGLESKFKDLSDVTLGLGVKSKEISEADKKLAVLNANFSSATTTTLSIYTESTSPTFVSIFEDVLFNKKTLTR